MKCPNCGSLMIKKRVDVDETWKGRTVTFRGIEVDFCADCGEEVFSATDIAMMESLIEGALDQKDYPEIMDVEEVSRFLRVTPQTIYNMLRDGRIKATKIGREWRFPKEAIMKIFDLPSLTPPTDYYLLNDSVAGSVHENEPQFHAGLPPTKENLKEKK